MSDKENTIEQQAATAQMRSKKMELEKLLGDLFETGIVPNSKRNKFLVNLVLFCVTVIVNFIKTDNDSLL